MKQLPDDRTLTELLSMGKDLEAQARKVYEMSEAFAQKYEQILGQENTQQEGSTISSDLKTPHGP
jgi:hypothetical protein